MREICLQFRPRHAVPLAGNQFAVSSYVDNQVYVVDAGGQTVRSYGSGARGSGVGPIYGPGMLAVAADNSILVADQANDRLIVIDATLTTASDVKFNVTRKGLQKPCCVEFDLSRGRMYVGEWSPSYAVQVFRI